MFIASLHKFAIVILFIQPNFYDSGSWMGFVIVIENVLLVLRSAPPIHQRASSIQVLLNPTSDHRPLRVSYIFNYVLVFILIMDRDQGS